MSTYRTGNKAFDDAANLSEGQRQVAVMAATTQSAARTAEITHYQTLLALAIANKVGSGPIRDALRELKAGGV